MTTTKSKMIPMRTSGVQHLIERTYREGGRYQWVREVAVNALEAGATRIEFGVEWQAVQHKGVYRRTIIDNGKGMTADELVSFFNTFGGGGKNIGGIHENFGVGSKTSLMPWNHHGIVVISWVGGEGSMIWVQRDEASGEYGLRLFRALDEDGAETLEAVVEPFEDRAYGCDWSQIKPEWVKDHGTAIVLLGNTKTTDTILGDPNREEADLKGIGSYLNRRLWELPAGVEIVAEEVRTSDRRAWPRSAAEAYGPEATSGVDRRINRRTIMGARHYVTYPSANFKKGKLGASGCMTLQDHTKAHWYLWEGERPGVQSYAAYQGYVAALYKNELYDVTSHLATYRSFGVTDPGVRQRLTIVLEPAPYSDETKRGVYPRTDRNALLRWGDSGAGEALPMHAWAAEFADRMPDPIRDALRDARKDEGELDEAYKDRLQDRFGTRWRLQKFRKVAEGSESEGTVDPLQTGQVPRPVVHRKKKRREEPTQTKGAGGTGGQLALGLNPGPAPASKVRVAGGIPSYRLASADEVEPGMLAAWLPHAPDHPEGVVLVNSEHPVIQAQVRYWTSQYPDHLANEVERVVLSVYGELGVSRVAHSEHLRGILPSEVVDKELRSDAALTMSMLGLVAEEAVISVRLGAKFGKRRQPAPEPVLHAEAAIPPLTTTKEAQA